MSFYLYHKCEAEKGEFTVTLDDPMTFPPGSKWKVTVVKFQGPDTYRDQGWTAHEGYFLCADIVCNSYVHGKHVRLISNFEKNDAEEEYSSHRMAKLAPFYVSIDDQHVILGINKISFEVINIDGRKLDTPRGHCPVTKNMVAITLHFKSD